VGQYCSGFGRFSVEASRGSRGGRGREDRQILSSMGEWGEEFKRLCGVRPETSAQMVAVMG